MRSTRLIAALVFAQMGAPLWAGPFAPATETACKAEKSSLLRDQAGTLVLAPDGIEFQPEREGKELLSWQFDEIQQLKIAENSLELRTYRDRRWLLGQDQTFQFEFSEPCLTRADSQWLREKISGVFVDALGDRRLEDPKFSAAVKLLRVLGGNEGVLEIGDREIVFRSSQSGESRLWTYDQIQSFAQPSRREFELTADELKFGGPTRTFRFQLKTPLPEGVYDYVWVRLHPSSLYQEFQPGGQR